MSGPQTENLTISTRRKYSGLTRKSLAHNWDLYLLILPVLAYFIVFHYWPMYGIQIAFKDFIATRGIWGSPWVGIKHFQRFFDGYYFWRLITNTITISIYSLVVGFPIPIIMALMINEVKSPLFKKTVQTVTYMPHFISTVVLVGMLVSFLSPQNGIVNNIIEALGGERVFFLIEPSWFKTLYVFSGVWQNAGWETIIYIAALTGIDYQIHEAAIIDGATRLQRMWYINIPGIMPTIIMLFILSIGGIMNVGFEKVFLMQNDLNMPASDVISTYVYRMGILGGQFSFSTAVGLFNSIINFSLLVIANQLARHFSETSLW